MTYTSAPNCLFGSALQVLVLTGARRSELLALRFSDIDYENRLIHLRRKVLAEKGGELKFYDTMKNAQSKRALPLSHLIELIIAKAKLENRTENSDTPCDTLIFRKPNDNLIRPDELTN